MPYPFLLPEEVSAADAKQVLDFLNGAESAEQIDAAIEIPQQPDIGPMLALRLFRRRQELGQFTSLNQIYAIPYIGPQRFTQIVVSLSSARPPINPQPNTALLDLLSERIALLEQRLNPQPSIRLRAINPEALLGQESILLAEVLAADGRPLIDQPVTFVTTWGVLRGRHGLQPVAGTSINVRSDHLGLCKVRLRAAAGENLSVTELDNLTQALTLLGSAAGSPRDNLQGLTELVRQYRAMRQFHAAQRHEHTRKTLRRQRPAGGAGRFIGQLAAHPGEHLRAVAAGSGGGIDRGPEQHDQPATAQLVLRLALGVPSAAGERKPARRQSGRCRYR